MLNLKTLPVHIRRAAKQIDLVADALARANRGREWLDKHAPPDWRLQMMSITGGKISSRVRLPYGDQNPLALAFRRDKSLKNGDGRVIWASVSDRFGFTQNRKIPQELGFLEKRHQVENALIDENIDGYFLDDAWETILKNLRWYPQPVAPYPKKEEPKKSFSFFSSPDRNSLLTKMAGETHRDQDT